MREVKRWRETKSNLAILTLLVFLLISKRKIGYNHFMKTENVIINDHNVIREHEEKLEAEHVESMKQAAEEIRKMLDESSMDEAEE